MCALDHIARIAHVAEIPAQASASLAEYLMLLDKWNKAYNLTAIRDIDAMVGRHLLDSLAIRASISGSLILDVGTGAGLPGIPLAVVLPEQDFVLLDSNGKKTRFLQEVKRVLRLDNISIVQARVQDFRSDRPFDTIISRAFASIPHLLDSTAHLLAANGSWVAMKALHVDQELANIQYPYHIIPYTVPDVAGDRCYVVIKKT